MTGKELQPKRQRGMNGGRSTNWTDIDNVLKKRENGIKYGAINELTGIPISTLEGYVRDFTRDGDGNVIRKPKR
jgi:hypothetical protein